MLTRLITYGAALTTALLFPLSALGSNATIVKEIRHVFGPRHDDTAVCLAGYESTGEPGHFKLDAVSPTNDYGLFQIHDGLQTYGRRIYGLVFNTSIAYKMSSHGRDFSPWTGTYGRGLCHGLS
jgi:hypothetical protein